MAAEYREKRKSEQDLLCAPIFAWLLVRLFIYSFILLGPGNCEDASTFSPVKPDALSAPEPQQILQIDANAAAKFLHKLLCVPAPPSP